MSLRIVTLASIAGAFLTLTACQAPDSEPAATPDTAATLPEGQNETTGQIEPSLGASVGQGGGIPGSSQPEAPATPDGTVANPPLPRDPPTGE